MFRTIAINILLSVFLPAMFACGKAPDPVKPDPVRTEQGGEPEDKNDTAMPETIKISVSGKTLPVKIEHNAASEALIAALREAPITYKAHDYGGFEKVGALGRTLPASDTHSTNLSAN